MAAYSILVQEFLRDTPEIVEVAPTPYNLLHASDTQVLTTYQKLQ
jgi:hypothetical protein